MNDNEKSKIDPNSNGIVNTGKWKPDEEFFEEKENWKFVKEKYGV